MHSKNVAQTPVASCKDAFKALYGDTFSRIHGFMKRYHGTESCEEWEALVEGMQLELNDKLKLELLLVDAVVEEIESVYKTGIAKTQGDFDPLHHDIFGRIYKLAWSLYAHTQHKCNSSWNNFVEALRMDEKASVFEKRMVRACLSHFLDDEQRKQHDEAVSSAFAFASPGASATSIGANNTNIAAAA